jgi:translocation and assembly module TamB
MPTRTRIIGKRILFGLGSLAALAVFLAAGTIALLQTGWGRGTLVDYLGQAANARVEGLDGMVPFDFTIDSIALEDSRGVWLEAEKVHVDWSPLALLTKWRIEVEDLTAGKVMVHRAPASEDKEADAPRSLPDIPPLAVRNMAVNMLGLGPGLLGGSIEEPAWFRVGGLVSQLAGDTLYVAVEANRLDGPEATATIKVSFRGDSAVSLQVEAREAAGGMVADVTGKKELGPVHVTLGGAGLLKEWRGRLDASAGGLGTIEGDIALSVPSIQETASLDLNGIIRPAQGAGLLTGAAILPEAAAYTVRTRYEPDQTLVIDQVVLDFQPGGAAERSGDRKE